MFYNGFSTTSHINDILYIDKIINNSTVAVWTCIYIKFILYVTSNIFLTGIYRSNDVEQIILIVDHFVWDAFMFLSVTQKEK